MFKVDLRMFSVTIFVLTVLLFVPSMLVGQGLMNIPARPAGQGNAFVAYPMDGNAPIWNPAGMELMDYRVLTGTYSRTALGDSLLDPRNDAYLAYTHHFGRKGRLGSVGIYWAQFFSDSTSEGELALSLGKRLWGERTGKQFSFGLNAKVLRSSLSGETNENKLSYSLDAGVYFRPFKLMSFGFVAKDILEPEIGFDDENPQKLGMTFRGGVALHTSFIRPQFEIEYLKDDTTDNNIRFNVGVEKDLFDIFTLRAGMAGKGENFDGDPLNDLGAGFSFLKSGEKVRWGLDYSFVYPMDKFDDFGFDLATHKIALNLYFAPPPVPLEDLELIDGKVKTSPQDLFVGSPVTLTATVRNNGEKDENNVGVSVFFKDTLDVWKLALPIDEIDVKQGEEKTLIYEWVPKESGHYTIYMAVDDDGSDLPNPDGDIFEVEEDNNIGVGEFNVFDSSLAQIKPTDKRLDVSELTLMREEEPIIPVVFFDRNSAVVRERYAHMLGIISKRLKENPDAVVHIKGFYAENSDDGEDLNELALARAVNTRKKMVDLGAPGAQVTVDKEGYRFSESRVGNPSIQLNTRSREYQYAENRRAELFVSMTDNGGFLSKVDIEGNTISSQAENALSKAAASIKGALGRNSEAIVLVDGIYLTDNAENEAKAFTKAQLVIEWLREHVADEFKDKIYLTTTYSDWESDDIVSIYSNGEGILYRPRLGDMVMRDYEMGEGKADNLIEINANVEAGVDSFAISIVDTAGRTTRVLAAGRGDLPNGLGWDWRDDAGRVLDFQNQYMVKLEVVDELGEHIVTTSDKMTINVTRSAKKIERLVIVLFMFNQSTPQSKFLESRIEYTARRLIDKAERHPEEFIAVVAGHTDSIGAEYANNALSQRRAQRELERLRKYLVYLLDLNDEKELNTWLRERNTTLKAKGMGQRQPYVISIWKEAEGRSTKMKIGDNGTPEGRTINRRVLLDLEAQYK